jgi:hypothetical protein
MHIHNSMLTFKQFLRTAQLLKSKTVDPEVPGER